MSRQLTIKELSAPTKKAIQSDLELRIDPNEGKKGKKTYAKVRTVYPIEVTDEHAYVPFAYGRTAPGGPHKRPPRNTFPTRDMKFEGALRPEQKIVKKECLRDLGSTGSSIIAAYPGFGKCLAAGTKVLSRTGAMFIQAVPVEEIIPGDVLVGDDWKPRTVYSTITGLDMMFTVHQEQGENYTVNEAHILSLMGISGTVTDIAVRDYMKLPEYIQNTLLGYRVPNPGQTITTRIRVTQQRVGRYYGFSISGNRRFLLGDCTVTHNTATAIYLAAKLSMPTMIVSHRIVLINQWKEALSRFCPESTVQVVTGRTKAVDTAADFIIMNATNVPKRDRSEYRHLGLLIVDELHLIMAEGLSKCMTRFVPRYVLGLSATPKRLDGLTILIDLYFGTNIIYRKLQREHIVYKLCTSFVPTMEQTKAGRLDWNSVINSQAFDEGRNEMIVRIIQYFPDRVFLVLCKRIDQGNHLVNRLTTEGESVTSLIGSQQTYDKEARVLVGIASKTGTGFDHPRLDAMIIASDLLAFFIQYLGRIFRRVDTIPVVFDIVDNNHILKRHFSDRKVVYKESGGTIKDFNKEFPDFSCSKSVE